MLVIYLITKNKKYATILCNWGHLLFGNNPINYAIKKENKSNHTFNEIIQQSIVTLIMNYQEKYNFNLIITVFDHEQDSRFNLNISGKASYKEKINPFDIVLTSGENIINLKSDFGISSAIRILANLILPGSGTFSSICVNCRNFCCGDNFGFCSLITIGVLQLYMGGIFFFYYLI